jgi:rare lipoprotein A
LKPGSAMGSRRDQTPWWFAASFALVAGCTSLEGPAPAGEPKDGAPRHPPSDLARLPDPVPRVEPKSRYGNPPSYVVFGKTYYVMDRADGYAETGLASWYGTKFHGRPTSSGEHYDMYKLTAAHRSLPIPTYVRVTNLDNQRSAILRVNDRGPFHADRVLDVSYAAAVKLGFSERGTARVRVEALTGSPEPRVLIADSAARPGATGGQAVTAPVLATATPMLPPPQRLVDAGAQTESFYLQAGAFRQLSGAEQVRSALSPLVGGAVQIHRSAVDTLYRVRVGPIADLAEANRLQALIAANDHGTPLIVRE